MAKPNCSKCGELKVGSYVNGSQCGKCIEARRAERRRAKREAAGLPEWGTGRDPKCKQCRAVKEESYKSGSLCRACKLAKAKVYYDKKARAAGVSVQKKGRNPLCGTCGIEKENKDDYYCHACRAKMKRERYEKLKQVPGFMEEQREKARTLYAENADHAQKRRCREATHRRIASGQLTIEPCEACGATENIEAHHEDYYQPMEITWLCKKHHAMYHAENTESLTQYFNDKMQYEKRLSAEKALKRGIRGGYVLKAPCEVCGTDENVEAHHDDYMRPLDVRWLCRTHHGEHHRMND